MSKHKEYQKTISQIGNSVNCIKEIKDEDEIINPYKDEFTTTQQRSRDKNITALLQSYVNAYNYKNSSNKCFNFNKFYSCINFYGNKFWTSHTVYNDKVCSAANVGLPDFFNTHCRNFEDNN